MDATTSDNAGASKPGRPKGSVKIKPVYSKEDLVKLSWWSTEQVAQYLGCSAATVRAWRCNEKGQNFPTTQPQRYKSNIVRKILSIL